MISLTIKLLEIWNNGSVSLNVIGEPERFWPLVSFNGVLWKVTIRQVTHLFIKQNCPKTNSLHFSPRENALWVSLIAQAFLLSWHLDNPCQPLRTGHLEALAPLPRAWPCLFLEPMCTIHFKDTALGYRQQEMLKAKNVHRPREDVPFQNWPTWDTQITLGMVQYLKWISGLHPSLHKSY